MLDDRIELLGSNSSSSQDQLKPVAHRVCWEPIHNIRPHHHTSLFPGSGISAGF
jgi:hypothetical protein